MMAQTKRSYDSSGRRQRAQLTQEAVLDAAQRRFLSEGYAATTIASVAADAQVSVETVYKAFNSKPGLVGAIWKRGLEGAGRSPAPERSDQMQATEHDPRQIIR